MPRPLPITKPSLARSPASSTKRLRFPSPPPDGALNAQLDRILSSRTFAGARRSQLFLRYILHHAVAHPGEQPKEYSIAVDVFDRDASYDPAVNNTVRVEAGRLRSRLREYYALEGRADPLLIEVPKGSYRVLVHTREPGAPAAPASPSLAPLLAVPLAFLLGAFFGYRASH